MTENSRYYYTSGNAARKIAPQREYERAPQRRTQPQTQTRLKKRADRVIGANTENGVAVYLEEYFGGKTEEKNG